MREGVKQSFLSVSSVKNLNLNIDRVKYFLKLTVALTLQKKGCVPHREQSGSTYPLFNVGIVRHFNMVNIMDTVESEYSLTQHVSTILWIRWSLGIICMLCRLVSLSTPWSLVGRRVSKSILDKSKMGSGKDKR